MSKKIVGVDGLTREEWLEYRRKGIGGSDAGVICGLNPYKSLIELWADKTGRIPDKEDNESMRIGRDLEQYVAERFCEATGKKVRRRNFMFRHDDYCFITANIDREIVGENAGLECKTTNSFNKSDFENGEIPQTYYCQCMHYMNVMGYDKMYLAVLVMGKAFYWFEIPYDPKEGETLLKMEREFWENYIISDVRPEPDGSESAKNTLDTIYADRTDDIVALTEFDDIADELYRVKKQKKEIEGKEEELKNKLVAALGGSLRGTTINYNISYSPRSRTSINEKALKEAFPNVYDKFKTISHFNALVVKEKKKS